MKIFVTGATGFVGSAVVKELVKHGHQVVGLARSEEGMKKVKEMGGEGLRGDLTDLEVLKKGASDADAGIHLGFSHDFTNFKANCEMDRAAIEAMGTAVLGSKKPLIVTGGLHYGVHGEEFTEDMKFPVPSPTPRVSEEIAMELADRGVYITVIRLPIVHGENDPGFVPILMKIAQEKGVAAYLDDGSNYWPAVHRLDCAVMYRLAVEKGSKRACYHAVAEKGIPFKEIAEAIGHNLKVPVVSKAKAEASEHFGWFASFAGISGLASSKKTQEELGWHFHQPGLLEDIRASYPKA